MIVDPSDAIGFSSHGWGYPAPHTRNSSAADDRGEHVLPLTGQIVEDRL